METKRRVVVPGELITTERKRPGSHVFIEDGKIYSDVLGLTYTDSPVASVIPLHGKYMPQSNDLIVGIVVNETFRGYLVDINSFYFSFISKEYLREPLQRGSVISAKITEVNEINEAELDDVRVFYGGDLITVSPVKAPRIIGKNGSMLDVLKQGTGCSLLVGRNGRIWVKDGNSKLLIKAIRKIEDEAHMSNLTNRIEKFLKKGE